MRRPIWNIVGNMQPTRRWPPDPVHLRNRGDGRMVAKGRIEQLKCEAANSRSGWKMVIRNLRGYLRL